MRAMLSGRKHFKDLSEQEILALAISSEEDDARIYRGFAQRLRDDCPATAKVFEGMALEEDEHRKSLIDLHVKRFGETIPLIRREHVSGFYARRPVWLMAELPLEKIREIAGDMEAEADGSTRLRRDGPRMPIRGSSWAPWPRPSPDTKTPPPP